MRSTEQTLRNAAQLQERGLIPAEQVAELEKVARRYAVALTPAMAELIDPADAHDPIARQFVPDSRELDVQQDEIWLFLLDHAKSVLPVDRRQRLVAHPGHPIFECQHDVGVVVNDEYACTHRGCPIR